MGNKIDRRDLLKLMGLIPASLALEPLGKRFLGQSPSAPHVIILIFDAWSATNLKVFGYPRDTMPNLNKFLKRSTVYHNHYSAGNYTVPGTASLLTGTYPWTHRALNLGAIIRPELAEQQIFKAVAKTHKTVGFSQNVYADQFLYQAGGFLDKHIPTSKFNLDDSVLYDSSLFSKDAFTAFTSFENGIFQPEAGFNGSLLYGPLARLNNLRNKVLQNFAKGEQYYRGLPESLDGFDLSDLMDGLISTLDDLREPSLVYFHCFPPHEPYRPYARFFDGFFDDGYKPAGVDLHPLVFADKDQAHLNLARATYDAYLSSWDDELDGLFSYFEKSGLYQNANIILTSDHGEMFDHGLRGHSAPILYDPLIHIPLFISAAGQTERIDVTSPTSSVDLLPTIAKITNNPIPDWSEGELLPQLGGIEDKHRPIYSFDAQRNSAFTTFSTYSVSIMRDKKKLVKYSHSDYSEYEFYDLENDPNERQNLASEGSLLFQQMRQELTALVEKVINKDGNMSQQQ